MKKIILLTLFIIVLASPGFALETFEGDSDANGAIDILYGGTNAQSAAGIRANINVEDGAEANEPLVSQSDAEAGTSTVEYSWSPLRIYQAIVALGGGGGSTDPDDLDGDTVDDDKVDVAIIPTGAVADSATTLSTGDQIYDFVIGLGYSTFDGVYSSLTGLPSLVTTWLGLSDTPSSYEGRAGQYTKVNDAETALEFGTPEGAGNVQAPSGSVVDGNLVAFDSTSGELLKDSGYSDSSFVKTTDIGTSVQAYSANMDTDSTDDFSGAYGDLSDPPTIPTASSLSVDDLISLSGVPEGSTNLGEFTGSTIDDDQTNKQAIQALETAIEGLPGGHDAVTLDSSATTGGMSLSGQAISNQAATNAQNGYMTSSLVGNIETNNSKNTNVPTALSTGTRSVTTYGITSDGSSNDVILLEATTDYAGLLGADKWDEIVANTAKVTYPGYVFGTGAGDMLEGNTVFVASEADPIVGAITGVPVADGAGNISTYDHDAADLTGTITSNLILGDADSPTTLGEIGYDGSNLEIGNNVGGTDVFIPEGEDASYQDADDDLTDLADGELTASKVGGVKDADYGDVSVSSGVWSVDVTGGMTHDEKDASFTVYPNYYYEIAPIDTIVATTSATPTAGDTFGIAIPYLLNGESVSIDFNGAVFQFGTDDILSFTQDGPYSQFTYVNATVGWWAHSYGVNDYNLAAAVIPCSAEYTNTTVGTADLDINDLANESLTFVGSSITPTVTVTVCQVDFYISYKAGDISSKTFRAYLCTKSGANLNVMTEADATVTGSNDWSDSSNSVGTAVTFEWSAGYEMTGSTEYAVVVTMDTADVDNYAELEISVEASIPGGSAEAWAVSKASSTGVPGSQVKMVVYAQ